MTTHNITKKTEIQNLTRRKFLTKSCIALSGAATGLKVHKTWAQERSRSTEIKKIDPGYIGPQFFDEKEEQALMEI